jgi:hypothetical protein
MEEDKACKYKHEKEDAKSSKRETGGGRQANGGSRDGTITYDDTDVDDENTQQSESA